MPNVVLIAIASFRDCGLIVSSMSWLFSILCLVIMATLDCVDLMHGLRFKALSALYV
uniref:Uncharacterized protein n=1 Tax=Rhizophora mucronata TaxID=61149 RepID=A0A2P2R151_RHIMU